MATKVKKKSAATKYLKLKHLRELCGFKQADFGRFIGLSESQYCKKERGTSPFSLIECKMLTDKINAALKTEYTVDAIFLSTEMLISNS